MKSSYPSQSYPYLPSGRYTTSTSMYQRDAISGNWSSMPFGKGYMPAANEKGLRFFRDISNIRYGVDGKPYFNGGPPAMVNTWWECKKAEKEKFGSMTPEAIFRQKYSGKNEVLDAYFPDWNPVRNEDYMTNDLKFAEYATRSKGDGVGDEKWYDAYEDDVEEVEKHGRRTLEFDVTTKVPNRLVGAYVPPQRYQSDLYSQRLWSVGKNGAFIWDANRMRKALLMS